MKFTKVIYYLFLSIVILIALLLITSMLPISRNYKFMVVQSGSMRPAIKTGAVVMVKPVNDYKMGEVITFKEEGEKSTTHRINDIEVIEGEPYYITKGDANNAPDKERVAKNEIIGKVLLDIPYVGYGVNFAKQPLGFALIIIIPALVIIGDETRKIYREIKKSKDSS